VYVAPTTYWTEEDELPEGVNVGDVKEAEHEVENEQLNKVKVSDVEGDANVAGVFCQLRLMNEAHPSRRDQYGDDGRYDYPHWGRRNGSPW
jgi:hypothetical protein